MDSFNLSLDQLAKETFDLGRQLTFEDHQRSEDFLKSESPNENIWQEDSFQEIQEMQEVQEIEQEEIHSLPQSAGILFKIEKTSGTFCIKAIACSSLEESFQLILDKDQETLDLMKVSDVTAQEIFYFETASLHRAEIICDQMANRRFPLDEDVLCNISDPGFSWWMNISEGSFNIYFNSHGINRADRFMQLGPLGDGSIAALRFGQLEEFLKETIKLAEFKCSEKSITIQTLNNDSRDFYRFQSIFSDGINDLSLGEFEELGVPKTVYLYLQEIADMRRFWLVVEQSLHSEI